ncbi:hypothetical protein [Mesobacillus maritimus]|nr:hypothetical protein [Mesobacillus maritimus]
MKTSVVESIKQDSSEPDVFGRLFVAKATENNRFFLIDPFYS